LDTIAYGQSLSKKRSIEGSVSVHGKISPAAGNRVGKISYLTHKERLLTVFTVRETLLCTSQLMKGVGSAEVTKQVDGLIHQLGLTVCADTLVSRLSGGQRRRCAVAVELINDKRDVLIMDEPTSGLDAHIALELIKCFIDLVGKGRTIVLSMHQPTSEIAALLTNVMVLTSKGSVGFWGSKEQGLEFLSALGYPAPKTWNPLDFFVEVVSDDFENRAGPSDVEDVSRAFAASKYFTERVLKGTKDSTHQLLFFAPAHREVGLLQQYYILQKRCLQVTWRNPGVLKVRTVIYTIVSVFIGLVFLKVGDSFDDQSIQSRNGVLFFVAGFYVFMSISRFCFAVFFFSSLSLAADAQRPVSLPFWIADRHVYISEKRNGLITPLPFAAAQMVTVALVTFILSLFTTIFIVPMVQLNNFGVYLGLLWVILFLADIFTAVVGTVALNFLVGLVVCMAYWSSAMMMEGFFITLNDIPVYFQWATWIMPTSYSFQTFMINEYGRNQTFDSTTFPDGQSVLNFFGYGPGGYFGQFDIGELLAILILAFVGGFLCLFYSIVRFVW